MDYGELTKSVPDPEEYSKESELRVLFDDCLNMKPNPFLFYKLPQDFLSLVSFLALRAS